MNTTLEKPPHEIPAEVHTDCYTEETNFDAIRWFEQASDEEILQLHECGWGGDNPSDEVALYFENKKGYENVTEVFETLQILRRKEDLGFECHVEEEKALNWIEKNRPYLHAIITNDDQGENIRYVATTKLEDILTCKTGDKTLQEFLIQTALSEAKDAKFDTEGCTTKLHTSTLGGKGNETTFYVIISPKDE